jgi:LEA14-like dessication related protein
MNIRSQYMPLLFVAAFFSVQLSSCKMYQEISISEVNKVEVKEFGIDGMSAEITVSINNPNWYKLTVRDSEVDLYFEGQKIATIVVDKNLVIPKKQVSTQTFLISASSGDMQTILGNALSLFFKSEFVLEGKGFIDGKALFVGRRVPVEFKQKLSKEDLGL